MATEAQIRANKENSLKSTGPKSDLGKENSRANALKHGYSGEGIVLPPELKAAVKERLALWFPDFQPQTERHAWLAQLLCLESVRIETGSRREVVLLGELAARAQETWFNDQMLEARLLFEKLPKRPEIVYCQLLQTKHGCQTLIEQWQTLGHILRTQGGWTPPYWSQALDLMGIPLLGREVYVPGPKENLAWIAEKIRELETLLEKTMEVRDKREQALTVAGEPFQEPKELKNHRRYMAACHRQFRWAWQEMERHERKTRPKPEKPEKAEAKTESKPVPVAPAPPKEPPPAPMTTTTPQPEQHLSKHSNKGRQAALARVRAEAQAKLRAKAMRRYLQG